VPFGIGPTELIIVLVIVLLVFGVGRLPEVGNSLGKGLREFRRAVTGNDSDSKPDSDKEKVKSEGFNAS
jgi:sec-independent protein translocase protein TatA